MKVIAHVAHVCRAITCDNDYYCMIIYEFILKDWLVRFIKEIDLGNVY